MPSPSPIISLWLDGRQSIQLVRKGAAGTTPVLKVHMHDTSKIATLVVPNYQSSTKSFNLQLAIQYGIIDLLDTKLHSETSCFRKTLSWKNPSPKPGHLLDWHTYEISWAHGDNVLWAYRGEIHQDTYEPLPVRLGKEPIAYTVLDNDMTLLLISVSVNPTDQVCHLSGEPRFGLKLEITSQYNEIITLCFYKTPLKGLHGLEEIVRVKDVEGQQVEWDWEIGCWEGPESFPSDDMFEEFKPGMPYVKIFWLTKPDENNNGGELTDLEAGKKYRERCARLY